MDKFLFYYKLLNTFGLPIMLLLGLFMLNVVDDIVYESCIKVKHLILLPYILAYLPWILIVFLILLIGESKIYEYIKVAINVLLNKNVVTFKRGDR